MHTMRSIVALCLIICLLVVSFSKKTCSPKKIWDHDEELQRLSHKSIRSRKDIVPYIRNLIQLNQNPLTKAECKHKRLLVLDTVSISFEGIGSVMKQVMIAIAAGFHSNRTVVW